MASLIDSITTTIRTNFGDLAQVKENLERIFAAQNENRFHVARTTAKQRIKKLKKIRDWIREHRSDIHAALKEDFRKPEAETDLSEILVVTTEIKHAISHLRDWMEPRPIESTLLFMTTSSHVQYEPRGVVLIVAPWNYPFNLSIGPLVSAIAAGNCAIIKPSELTPATSKLVGRLVSELFDENEVAVVEGDKEVAGMLLDLPFHHIFFTGSPAVGKIVQAAAAKHLTSVTLELGGKSPVIVDRSVNLDDAVGKIAWGKFVNNGQTCIAPDYALVHKDREAEFIEKMRKAVESYYGSSEEDRKESTSYARIISGRHHMRLTDLISKTISMGAKLAFGGVVDASQQYISPTLLTNVPLDAPLMKEEIFGPILPVLTFESLKEAVELIQKMEKPLALYYFGNRKTHIDYVLTETTAGGTCVNETMIHFMHPNLPFGGVNFSGSGSSHGIYGFRTFSHERAVLRHHRFSPLKLLYPPYTNFVQKITAFMVKYL